MREMIIIIVTSTNLISIYRVFQFTIDLLEHSSGPGPALETEFTTSENILLEICKSALPLWTGSFQCDEKTGKSATQEAVSLFLVLVWTSQWYCLFFILPHLNIKWQKMYHMFCSPLKSRTVSISVTCISVLWPLLLSLSLELATFFLE